MAKDRGKLPRVAWFLVVVALGGCGPSVRPDVPFPEETVAPPHKREPSQDRAGRQVVVGELCPKAADGRPAVAPLLLHTTQWIDTVADVTGVVERGSTPRFAAYGIDGKVAGVFETVGLADLTLGQSVAAGTYVGGSPCSADAGGNPRVDDPACVRATSGCGLAVAEITRPDDPPSTPAYQTGGACSSSTAIGGRHRRRRCSRVVSTVRRARRHPRPGAGVVGQSDHEADVQPGVRAVRRQARA